MSWPIQQYGVFREEPIIRRTELELLLPIPTPQPKKRLLSPQLKVLAVVLVLALIGLARCTLMPSSAASVDAPTAEFSAARALNELKPLGIPRSLGSPGHETSRAHLVQRLEALGLAVEEEQSISSAQQGNRASVARISNIVARLSGSQPEGAILLMSHYDSVPVSPGAADAGAGVVAILETLRALKAGPPLKQDVLVLLTDGEEAGLLGARAFARTLPLRKEIKAVINLEARGTEGAAILFETMGPAQELLKTYRSAAPRPLSSSLIHELYLYLPNDTDLSAFRVHDIPGLNLAFAEGLAAYHTSEDRIERLSPDSVQHMGEQLLGVVRALGSGPLPSPEKGSQVEFNLIPWHLVHYPVGVAFPLALLAALLTGAVLLLGLQRGVLSVKGLAIGLTIPVVAALITGIFATVFWPLMLRETGEYVMFYSHGDTWHSLPHTLGLSLGTVGVIWLLQRSLARRTALADLTAGGLIPWAAATLYAVVKLPLGAHVLTWPLLLAAGALGLWIFRQPIRHPDLFPESLEDDPFLQDPDRTDDAQFLAMSVGLWASLLFLLPAVMVLYYMSSLQVPGLIAAPSALMGALAVPWLRALFYPWKHLPLLAFFLVAAVPPTLTVREEAFDLDHPRPVSLLYAYDADQQAAWWVSMDEAPSAWNAGALGETWERKDLSELVPELNFEVLANQAPRWPRPAPSVLRLEELEDDGSRTLRLRIKPEGTAAWIDLAIDPRAQLSHVAVSLPGGGRAAEFQPLPGSAFQLRVFAPPAEGFELEVEAPLSELIMLRVVEVWPGFPGLADGAPAELMGPPEKGELRAPFQPDQIPGPLPPGAMLRPSWINGTTLVSVGYSF